MIAALWVENRQSNRWFGKLKAWCRPCDITASLRKHHKTMVLQIKYSDYQGQIHWKKLYPYLTSCQNTILCEKGLLLEGTLFRRFESYDYTLRLIRNFVSDLLEKASIPPPQLSMAYIDRMAVYPEMAETMLRYTSRLSIVTDMPKYYETQAEHWTTFYGVPITVSHFQDALTDNDIVITTEPIDVPLPLSFDTLVFTPAPPLVPIKGTVLYDYRVGVPYPYQRLKPPPMDDVYFLSGLYTLGGIKELENLVPIRCSDGHDLYTADRLIQRLQILRTSA